MRRPEASVVGFLSSARRRRNLRSGLESFALGVAAALVALAACWWGSAAAGQAMPGGWSLGACAAVSGLAMAGTWWVERAKKSDLELARQIDARLGSNGALSAAYEARLREDASPIVLLLERRVIAGIDGSSLRRALPAMGFFWLAPPAIGAALAALALELPPAQVGVSGDASGFSQGPQAAGARAIQRATSALDSARVQGAAARADSALRERLTAELDAVAAGLRGEQAASDQAALQADLLEQVLAERLDLAQDRTALPGDPSLAPGGLQTDPAASGTPVRSGSDAEAAKSLLTNGSPDRTMSGSKRPTAGTSGERTTTPVPESGPGEAGTLAGRWWDERYDPVVQGWRRALDARREQH